MQLLIVVLVVFVCCVLAVEEDNFANELSVEQRCWKKLEEIVDIIGIQPNPIPPMAENMLKRRCALISTAIKGIMAVTKAVAGAGSAAISVAVSAASAAASAAVASLTNRKQE